MQRRWRWLLLVSAPIMAIVACVGSDATNPVVVREPNEAGTAADATPSPSPLPEDAGSSADAASVGDASCVLDGQRFSFCTSFDTRIDGGPLVMTNGAKAAHETAVTHSPPGAMRVTTPRLLDGGTYAANMYQEHLGAPPAIVADFWVQVLLPTIKDGNANPIGLNWFSLEKEADTIALTDFAWIETPDAGANAGVPTIKLKTILQSSLGIYRETMVDEMTPAEWHHIKTSFLINADTLQVTTSIDDHAERTLAISSSFKPARATAAFGLSIQLDPPRRSPPWSAYYDDIYLRFTP